MANSSFFYNSLVNVPIFYRGDQYKARLGNEVLNVTKPHEVVRDIVEILRHPDYKAGRAYYDVGLVKVRKKIEFTDFVLPICLPFQPVDDEDDLADNFVSLSGWGFNNDNTLTNRLSLENLQVHTKSYCSSIFSTGRLARFGLPTIRLRQQLPRGFTPDVNIVTVIDSGLTCTYKR